LILHLFSCSTSPSHVLFWLIATADLADKHFERCFELLSSNFVMAAHLSD